MTTALALEYIPRRMKELGYDDSYSIQFRHFVLPDKAIINENLPNQLLILIEPSEAIAVRSDTGVFDATTENVNELQYEHRGAVQIQSYACVTQHVRFIQVIPNDNKTCP